MKRELRRIMVFTAVAGACLLVVSACGKQGERRLPCDQVFLAPRGAELLCDERVVSSRGEIHWRSYGSTEPESQLFDAYLRSAQACGYSWCTKCSDPEVSHGAQRLQIFAGTSTNHPTCAKAVEARAKYATVTLISEGVGLP